MPPQSWPVFIRSPLAGFARSLTSNWLNLGPALHLGGGLYRFTDPGAMGQPQRHYLLREQ